MVPKPDELLLDTALNHSLYQLLCETASELSRVNMALNVMFKHTKANRKMYRNVKKLEQKLIQSIQIMDDIDADAMSAAIRYKLVEVEEDGEVESDTD